MSQQGIVETISPRHVGRLLQEASLKPNQSDYIRHGTQTLIASFDVVSG